MDDDEFVARMAELNAVARDLLAALGGRQMRLAVAVEIDLGALAAGKPAIRRALPRRSATRG